MKHCLIGLILLNLCQHVLAQQDRCAGIITDKPYYLLGDTIRGHAMVLTSCQKLNHPLEITLLTPDGRPAVRQLMDYGGDSRFNLPLSGAMPEGMYQLMLSYPKASEELLLQQELAIINPSVNHDAENPDNLKASILKVYHHGPLVKGLPQDILVSITDELGHGQSAAAEVVTSQGDKITSFTTDETGLFIWQLVPDSATQYQIRTLDGKLKLDLPETVDTGISMALLPEPDGLTIEINGHYEGKELMVWLTGSVGAVTEHRLFPHHSHSTFRMEHPSKNSGLCQVQVFGPDREMLWQQLYFQDALPISGSLVLEKSANIGMHTEVHIRQPQEQENYFCSIIDGNQIPLIPYSPLQNPQWLLSKVSTDTIYTKALLMMWSHDSTILEQIFSTKAKRNVLEYGGSLQGRLLNNRGEPQRFVPVILSIPSEEYSLQYTVTSANGIFSFDGLLFEGMKSGYLYPMLLDPQELDNLHFEIVDDNPKEQVMPAAFVQLKKKLAPWIERQLLNRGIQELYHIGENTLGQESIQFSNPVVSNYGDADHVVNLNELVSFSTMREVVKEAMANVNFARKRIRVFSTEQRKNFNGSPLMLVDGMPTFSDSVILNMDPANLARIEIVNSRRKLMSIGALGNNGLIAFYTKHGKDVEDMTGVKKISIKGYDAHPIMSAGQASPIDPRTPELPEVIYWNPNLNPNHAIRFRLPNNLTYYHVLVGSYGPGGFHLVKKRIESK